MISLDTNILIQQGVTDFATVNEKDFRDCGFSGSGIRLLRIDTHEVEIVDCH
jgi:hypothetical protein